jgi:hypothetical protein
MNVNVVGFWYSVLRPDEPLYIVMYSLKKHSYKKILPHILQVGTIGFV